MEAPRFTIAELEAIERDAQMSLLEPDSHWLPLVLDLSRALRQEIAVRFHGEHT